MPIVVTCPGCPTKLSAPDTAAGKQVRCPKCGAAAPVPSADEPVVDATPAPKTKPRPVDDDDDFDRPKKKSRRDDDDDDADERPRKKARRRDDDDDDDDRPRKKKKRKSYADDDDDYDHDHPRRRPAKRGGGGGGMIAFLVVGGLLLLVVGGVAIFFIVGKGGLFTKKAPPPPGWEQYSYPTAGFKAHMPKKPADVTMPVNGMNLGGPQLAGNGFQADDFRDLESISVYRSGVLGDPVRVEMAVFQFRNRVPFSVRDRFRNINTGPFGEAGETRNVRWLGGDALEAITPKGVARVVAVDRRLIFAAVSGRGNSRATKEEEEGFFDNVELTK